MKGYIMRNSAIVRSGIVCGLLAGCMSLSGCARTALIHSLQTDDNHFVVIKGGRKVYDCYSKINGKWQPTCKEVKELNLGD
jgi:hypothetical protein